MSVIITRQVGAKKIDEGIIKRCIDECRDGWGIAWYRPGVGVGYQRDSDMSLLIDHIKKYENLNLKFIIHINDMWTGHTVRRNILPIFIKNIGLLVIDGYIKNYPENINKFDVDNNLKSDEIIIGELFDQYCENNTSIPSNKLFDTFLSSHRDIAPSIIMVLISFNGDIFNSSPEDGFHRDGNRLWISDNMETEDREILYEPLSEQLEYVCERLEEWKIIRLDELINLNKKELSYIAENYSRHFAELIKYGKTGYVEQDLINVKQCIDCDIYDSTEVMHRFHIHTRESWLCDDCYLKNGIY